LQVPQPLAVALELLVRGGEPRGQARAFVELRLLLVQLPGRARQRCLLLDEDHRAHAHLSHDDRGEGGDGLLTGSGLEPRHSSLPPWVADGPPARTPPYHALLPCRSA